MNDLKDKPHLVWQQTIAERKALRHATEKRIRRHVHDRIMVGILLLACLGLFMTAYVAIAKPMIIIAKALHQTT